MKRVLSVFLVLGALELGFQANNALAMQSSSQTSADSQTTPSKQGTSHDRHRRHHSSSTRHRQRRSHKSSSKH